MAGDAPLPHDIIRLQFRVLYTLDILRAKQRGPERQQELPSLRQMFDNNFLLLHHIDALIADLR